MKSLEKSDVVALLKRILHQLDENFEKPFLVFGMMAIIILISFQTIYRYIATEIFGITGSVFWVQEIARYIFVWISYIAVSMAIKNRSNIRIDVLYDRLPERFQNISWVVVSVFFLAFTLTILNLSINHIQTMLMFPQTTPALGIPFYLVYLILPLGFGLMSLRLIQDLIKQFQLTGWKDFLIGLAFCVALSTPLLIGLSLSAVAWLIGSFVVFLIIGVPVFIALGLSTIVTILGAGTLPMGFIAQATFTSIDTFPIMAIPFFVAAGVFMSEGGLSDRLMRVADELMGRFYGGMALTAVAATFFFAALSGSGPATVAAIATLTIPAMIKRGYCPYFSGALVAAAGSLGVILPPSNPFVVFGVSTSTSIGNLFIAGIIPGITMCAILMIFAYIYSRKKGIKGEERERTLKTFGSAMWDAKWALLAPFIILGGIYGGIMTPTEAASIAALYGLIVGIFIYKGITMKNIVSCLVTASRMSAIVITLIAMATLFGNIMTIERIPESVAAWVLGITDSRVVILLALNVMLLIIGTVLEALAAIVILAPILLPIVVQVGVDPVHFGVIMVVNLAIGFVTPPVGVNLFVVSGIANLKVARLCVSALPIVGVMLIVLLLVTFIPELSLFLPNLMR